MTPAGRYRDGLRALNDYSRAAHGKIFAQLPAQEQDAVLHGLESGQIDLKLAQGLSTRAFFELVLQNTMEGFFADPLYGGNKGMAGWKLVGFPGARYDYRDHIDKHNVPYPQAARFPFTARADAMAKLLPRKDVVIMGLGWTGSILAQELTDAGSECGGDRARAVARHRHRFQYRLHARRVALCHPQGICSCSRRRKP